MEVLICIIMVDTKDMVAANHVVVIQAVDMEQDMEQQLY